MTSAPQKAKPANPDIAQRMKQACDGNPNVPPPNYGRLGWLQQRFEEQGISISTETARRWFSGEVRPREKYMKVLAQILKVDYAWLSVGNAPALSEKQIFARNATASGAVNLVAGLIQMSGGTPAFPDNAPDGVDLHAIIKGGSYQIHVATAERTHVWTFAIPTTALNCLIIGVLWIGEFSFRFLELDADAIEKVGKRKGGHFEVTAGDDLRSGDHMWQEIRTFSKRL